MLAAYEAIRKHIKVLLTALAVLSLGLLVLLYLNAVGSRWTAPDFFRNINDLYINILPNLMATLISFIVGYFILEKIGILNIVPYIQELMSIKHLKGFYAAHKEVPWGSIYENAQTLDIGVFYYNHLPNEYFDSLVKFFGNGGRLRLLLADPDNRDLLKVVGEHFFQGMSPEDLAEKIRSSARAYYRAYMKNHSGKAKCEIWFFSKLFHYTFTHVDGGFLYISPYGQFESSPKLLSPVTVIDLTSDSGIRNYWDEQLKNFFGNARKFQPPENSHWLL